MSSSPVTPQDALQSSPSLAFDRRIAGAFYDEGCTQAGTVRPLWQALFSRLEAMGSDAFAGIDARARGYLTETGVVHRVYGEGDGLRPWPLSPIPILIGAAEWAELAAQVAERAALLNDLLVDAYGEATLVRSGAIPAALYAASPDYVRPMVRARHHDQQPLRFYAVDLARRTDGQWCVLSDRTQAPSGVGYALENRLAMAHAAPGLLSDLGVLGLADFFYDFRQHLASLQRSAEGSIALLSPGPMNESYFEHAFLARDLDLVLVEGEDLVVRDGAVFIRTVAGLKPCDGLWRRLDSDFIDPLDFNTRSRIGVPGLGEAARGGRVTLVNAIGSGLAESRAWMAALPRLAEHYFGRPLKLPTQTTWWGIDPDDRAVIASRFDALIVGSAFGAPLPGIGTGFQSGASLSADDRAALLARLAHRGVDIVAQEPIALSRTPAYENGRWVSRPFVLRVYAAWNGASWHVMPGGFARVSESDDERAVSLQRGGRSADVWIVPDAPRREMATSQSINTVNIPRSVAPLLSRAADHWFWFGRYRERAELMVRVARAALSRMDRDDAPFYETLAAMLVSHGVLPPFTPGAPLAPAALAQALITHHDGPQSLVALGEAVLNAASPLRDLIPATAFAKLKSCMQHLRAPFSSLGDTQARFDEALQTMRDLAAIARSSTDSTSEGRFFDLGQRIECGIGLVRVIERFSSNDPQDCALRWALVDRSEQPLPHLSAIKLDDVMGDHRNPHSLAHHITKILETLAALSPAQDEARMKMLIQCAQALDEDLTKIAPDDFDRSWLAQTADDLMRLSDEIVRLYMHPERLEPRS